MKQWKSTVVAGVLVLAGCSPEAPPATAEVPTKAQASLPAPVPDHIDQGDLRVRAEQALRDQRIHSPAGANAVEYYLALREREPDAPGVSSALTELQPYLLIAGEQALARGDEAEAQRLLVLIERVDAHAPALPRLRDGLQRVQVANREESAALAAALSPPVVRPAPTKPAPMSAPAAAPARAAQVETPPVSPAPAEVVESPTPTPARIAKAEVPPAPALPRLLSDSPPRYPAAALNRRLEGRVQLAFTIQPDGRVSDARLLSAQPLGVFDEAALAAASRWRFEATGQRVSTTRTLMFRLPTGS